MVRILKVSIFSFVSIILLWKSFTYLTYTGLCDLSIGEVIMFSNTKSDKDLA